MTTCQLRACQQRAYSQFKFTRQACSPFLCNKSTLLEYIYMYIRIAFSIELRLRVSRSLRSLANKNMSRARYRPIDDRAHYWVNFFLDEVWEVQLGKFSEKKKRKKKNYWD